MLYGHFITTDYLRMPERKVENEINDKNEIQGLQNRQRLYLYIVYFMSQRKASIFSDEFNNEV